ncbi:MAG: DUF1295 domain-containing protein [Clostridia bacterium]|nr:DUF1295 domain-containing protein [Clostridia bacterium]
MEQYKDRGWAFVFIALVYVVATAIAFLVYRVVFADVWAKVLVADVVATVVVFLGSLTMKNASVYDAYWSVQPIVIFVGLALEYGVNFTTATLIVVVCLWGIRLTANWVYTFKGINWQDWRYAMLKKKTKAAYPLINFLGIHLFPTLVVYCCVLPIIIVVTKKPQFNFGVAVGALISVCAFTWQGIADVQMHRFRKLKKKGFNRSGLWKYSRHPNYLGEICMWWGMAIACVFALPRVWCLCFGALVNTLMFLFVSIPMADKRQSRKAGFEQYKSQTRMLLPIKKG